MAKASDNDEEMISGINVTPLVDITLVLLIIFMVTATYIVRESIEIDLPRAAHGGETVGELLNVVLDKEGALYLDGAKADEAALVAKAKEALLKDPSARAIISADKSATHGAVVRVIDLVKGAGIAKFAINIEKDGLSSTAAPAPAPAVAP
ncbi:MAG: biopolymer transporter ExbD [Myxococcales bacterium]|jgi:biopolymer transport protein ExbD|nr:biopolymer transporter ExbD [Myxococcales bacterium]